MNNLIDLYKIGSDPSISHDCNGRQTKISYDIKFSCMLYRLTQVRLRSKQSSTTSDKPRWLDVTLCWWNSDILMKIMKFYKSLVRPHVEYCTAAWSPHYTKDKQLLEKIQHRFTRIIPGMKKLLYTERLRRLGLWSLETRRYRADLIEVYKMIHGLSGARFDCFFDFDNSGRTRGIVSSSRRSVSNFQISILIFVYTSSDSRTKLWPL